MSLPLRSAFIALALSISFSGSSCAVDPTPNCHPGNCSGCCDRNDQCQVGVVITSCGVAGNACDVCVSPQTCQLGRCASTVSSGGGAGGGTGGGTTGGGTGGGTTTGGGTGGGTPMGGGTGGGAGPHTVTGRATYDFVPSRYVQGQGGTLYFNQTVAKPIRNAVVRVVEGATVLATTNTAEDGTYALAFTSGGGAIQVQVLARTSTPAIQIEDNTDANVTWAFGSTLANGATTLDLNATHGWTGTGFTAANRRAAPFAILDSMYTAAKAFMAVRTVAFPALKVNWSPNNAPQAGNKALGQIGTSHFASNENEIYVLGLAGADTDEFDSHVIVHEWGHYFEDNLSRSDSPGGPHGSGDVLDPRIAFGEAWGTALAAMVLPETMYTDSMWNGGTLGAWGYDAETIPSPTDDPSPSGFSENAVLRALYDLYDTPADGAWDQVGVGLGTVYDVLTGPERTTDALTTMASFVTGLKARPGANAAGINAVLAHYSIGPVTTDFGVGDSNLSGMFTASPIPYTGGIGLIGGHPSNSYQQNQYFVFTGTGRTTTITGNAAQDVGLQCYRRGTYVGGADATTSGTEQFSLATTAGATYVVVVVGYGQTAGTYNVSLTITSP